MLFAFGYDSVALKYARATAKREDYHGRRMHHVPHSTSAWCAFLSSHLYDQLPAAASSTETHLVGELPEHVFMGHVRILQVVAAARPGCPGTAAVLGVALFQARDDWYGPDYFRTAWRVYPRAHRARRMAVRRQRWLSYWLTGTSGRPRRDSLKAPCRASAATRPAWRNMRTSAWHWSRRCASAALRGLLPGAPFAAHRPGSVAMP